MCGDFLAIVQKTILCNLGLMSKKQPNKTKQTNRLFCEFFNILKLVVEISLCLKNLSCSLKIPKQNNTNRMAMKCRNPTNKQYNQPGSINTNQTASNAAATKNKLRGPSQSLASDDAKITRMISQSLTRNGNRESTAYSKTVSLPKNRPCQHEGFRNFLPPEFPHQLLPLCYLSVKWKQTSSSRTFVVNFVP